MGTNVLTLQNSFENDLISFLEFLQGPVSESLVSHRTPFLPINLSHMELHELVNDLIIARVIRLV